MNRLAQKAVDEFEDHVLAEVCQQGDGYALTHDGLTLFVAKSKFRTPPRAGQTARFYGGGIGRPVRGLDIDGVEIYWESEEDYRARVDAEQRTRDDASKDAADRTQAERDARVAALPDCFQKRIARFRRNLPSFYWQHEGYEMSSCESAVQIADACKTVEAVREFAKLSWAEQKARLPDLYDGHSGNTFGMAIRLAHHYLSDPRLVFADHAAISALLGCEGAGCAPVTDAEMREAGYEPFSRSAEKSAP